MNQKKLLEINSKSQVLWKLLPKEAITNVSAVHSFIEKR